MYKKPPQGYFKYYCFYLKPTVMFTVAREVLHLTVASFTSLHCVLLSYDDLEERNLDLIGGKALEYMKWHCITSFLL